MEKESEARDSNYKREGSEWERKKSEFEERKSKQVRENWEGQNNNNSRRIYKIIFLYIFSFKISFLFELFLENKHII